MIRKSAQRFSARDHAPTMSQSAMMIDPEFMALWSEISEERIWR
jgi:hypothetical protein